ncbi:LysR family transcriptional regulator [Geobacter sulfurreducens]|uniref:Helix-turn-helix transcriptional regulator, LysR family n=1 Tax=Geobacter sulfurreducens (strain ATCC 51573 / DSM 12127 / PCA) TaxID=243231 RepID=Q74DP8_GEOSL|nr:LysR family transcriptional regulator [Geobacter sulfurreducens]AAR34644.1 helix-turn-helix transcriptional regulator, LysR family [Geobacter sulfurreducens PCA]UAC05297.1 LysR family transcriptional regulator [Geobacter sulfurreducens]UTG93934.1 LysR family transcriptional regulator [Geobacter sulfurreducens]HBB69110.1 LysR family transcriptional regulator [Geobacter sulfurreducens]HCD97345.1 LysR family transcriptional regulator [Geobacter sulfurreducens]
METVYFKTLLAVVETGSFSRAAERLCITQSAVSQRIKLLEGRYGYTLIDRAGNFLVPTAAGELVIQKARVIIEHELALLGALKLLPAKTVISFCCSPCFGTVFLPALVRDFVLRNSEQIDFRCVLGSSQGAVRGLRDTDFNIIVIEHCTPLDLSPYDVISLPNDEIIFVSNPATGLDVPEPDLSQLLNLPVIMRKEGCSGTEQLAANLARFGKVLEDFRSVTGLDDPRLIVQTVKTEPYLAFVPKSLVLKELAEGSLRAHTVKGFSHARFRSLVTAPKRYSDPCRSNFIKAVMETVCHISAVSMPGDGPGSRWHKKRPSGRRAPLNSAVTNNAAI